MPKKIIDITKKRAPYNTEYPSSNTLEGREKEIAQRHGFKKIKVKDWFARKELHLYDNEVYVKSLKETEKAIFVEYLVDLSCYKNEFEDIDENIKVAEIGDIVYYFKIMRKWIPKSIIEGSSK